MTEQRLHCTNVDPAFEQMSRERVAEGVAARFLWNSGGVNRRLDLTLQRRFVQVMPGDPPRPRV